MHIAIEGLDGVGKTTASERVAERLGFDFIEKPLHYLTDREGTENYMRMTQYINGNLPADFTAMFYGLGNYFLSSELKKGKTSSPTVSSARPISGIAPKQSCLFRLPCGAVRKAGAYRYSVRLRGCPQEQNNRPQPQ